MKYAENRPGNMTYNNGFSNEEAGYKEHQLKLLPQFYEDVVYGNKRFELRKDDRDFKVGDHLWFREWNGKEYTGRSLSMPKIKYILRNCPEYGLMDGYCIIGF